METHDCYSGPRWLDADRAGSVAPATLRGYQKAALSFVYFLEKHQWYPATSDEMDDLMVEFSFLPDVSSSKLRNLYAGAEFFFAKWKGKFPWTKNRIDVMAGLVPVKHTLPAGMELCTLLAGELAALGRPRIGIGMLLQCAVGLRPGELTQLTPSDVQEAAEFSKKGLVIIRLGGIYSTKVGRQQFVLFRTRDHLRLWSVLQRLIRFTPAIERMFPYSVGTYNSWLKKCPTVVRLELEVTAHSPRAGFASDAIACGTPSLQVKESGRWISDTSFRTYVDIVGAQAVAVRVRTAGLSTAVAWVADHLDDYFPDWALATYHAGHHSQPRGRGTGRGRAFGAPAGRGAAGAAARSPHSSAARGRGAGDSARRGRGHR